MLGPTPFSPDGVTPYFVQILNPDLFHENEKEEERLTSKTETGMEEDPLRPSDARSDWQALTPMYRGNQNIVFDVQIDPYINHGPYTESLSYCLGNDWNNIHWDGSTFPLWVSTTKTAAEIKQHRKDWYNFVFPSDNFCIRGLKQLYDIHKPFKDEKNPTIKEWEDWNDRVLNHFRYISGLEPAIPSQELYIMCAWTKERKTTTLWDAKYPGTHNSAYGPCVGGTNLHCGSTFKPSDVQDQYPYWNEVFVKYPKVIMPEAITLTQKSEAITVWYSGTAMTAMSRNIRNLVRGAKDGIQVGGHGGPYCFRELYGLAIGRSKWAGKGTTPPSGYTY